MSYLPITKCHDRFAVEYSFGRLRAYWYQMRSICPDEPTSSGQTVQQSGRSHAICDTPTSSSRIPQLSERVFQRWPLDSGIARVPWLAGPPADLRSLPETA